jgi:hypothetical protein
MIDIPQNNSSWDNQPAALTPVAKRATREGYRVACYVLPLAEVPADFFADPDGQWAFESLVKAAGFSPGQGVAVGALKSAFNGHPDGAAVVTLNSESRPYVAIVECPIAFDCVAEANARSMTAA